MPAYNLMRRGRMRVNTTVTQAGGDHNLHKVANCLAALPKRAHADAKAALAKIYTAETRAAAVDAAAAFASDFAAHPSPWPRSPATSTCC